MLGRQAVAGSADDRPRAGVVRERKCVMFCCCSRRCLLPVGGGEDPRLPTRARAQHVPGTMTGTCVEAGRRLTR